MIVCISSLKPFLDLVSRIVANKGSRDPTDPVHDVDVVDGLRTAALPSHPQEVRLSGTMSNYININIKDQLTKIIINYIIKVPKKISS